MRIGLNAQVMYTGSGFRNAGVSRYTRAIVERLAVNRDLEFVLYVNNSVRDIPFPIRGDMRVTIIEVMILVGLLLAGGFIEYFLIENIPTGTAKI